MSRTKPVSNLPLFAELQGGEASCAGLEDIEWSHSRRSALFQCPRKYYYEYFGSNLRKAQGDPRKAKLRNLKVLKNRFERAGEILHFVIRAFFKKAQQGEIWEVNRLTSWARSLIAKDVSFSRNMETTDVSSDTFPPVPLLEFYYKYPDREQQMVEITKRLEAALRNFYHAPDFYFLRQAGISTGTLIETKILIPNTVCKASGVVDLAFQQGRLFLIADWKMGQAESVENLQLMAYGFWARSEFGTAPEDLRLYLASLTTGSLKTIHVTDSALNDARVRIMQDAQCMATMVRYGLEGIEDAFTPCAQARVCRLCSYQEVCPEGQMVR